MIKIKTIPKGRYKDNCNDDLAEFLNELLVKQEICFDFNGNPMWNILNENGQYTIIYRLSPIASDREALAEKKIKKRDENGSGN